MLLAGMVVNSRQATLHNAPKAFNVIRISITIDILPVSVSLTLKSEALSVAKVQMVKEEAQAGVAIQKQTVDYLQYKLFIA